MVWYGEGWREGGRERGIIRGVLRKLRSGIENGILTVKECSAVQCSAEHSIA